MPNGLRADHAVLADPFPTNTPLDRAVTRAVGGDSAGFAEVWESLNPPLLRYLLVRGSREAEDIAAETWMAVVRGVRTFEGDGASFTSWLFTIARSKLVDAARYASRRPVTFVADDNVLDGVAADPSEVVFANDDTQAALRLIRQLPADQAEIVALRVVADLDVASVAKIVGKTAGAVRVAQHRGLQRLAGLVGTVLEGGVTR